MSDLFSGDLVRRIVTLLAELEWLDQNSRVEALNAIRLALHRYSPFKGEPVDCVQWIPTDQVHANDYNPNTVAPPEMRLLEHSVSSDGYTQPIVAWKTEETCYEVVDGFHRHRVGCESPEVRKRIHGYLPLAIINAEREDRGDRIAATIRHNRARGKHRVTAMSDIVVELKRRNWSEDRICRELGMDADEVLRLCQITGLTELFSNQEFSKAWEVSGHLSEDDFAVLSDDVPEGEGGRTVNTSDPDRIFHPYETWECYKAGFYATGLNGLTMREGQEAYREFLADPGRFEAALAVVTSEWTHSCEHYLTNVAMNRIAWLGQAAMCQATHVPAMFRGGFGLLSAEQQETANTLALTYLNQWLMARNRAPVTMDEAMSGQRQSDIY